MTRSLALILKIPSYGICQTLVQLHEGYTLARVRQQIPLDEHHARVVGTKLIFVSSIHDERRRKVRYLEQKPNEDLSLSYFFGSRQCGQLEVGYLGLGEKQRLQACVRTDKTLSQEQREGSLTYVLEALVAEIFQFGYDALSFAGAHQTSLNVYFHSCLQSSARLFRGFQSKFLPFSFPLSGV